MLLDTNVISEMWRPRPNPTVAEWLDAQPADRLYICAPVLAEIRFGIERLPDGPRKAFLADRWTDLAIKGYRGRVLDFDLAAAAHYGAITAHREKRGRRLEPIDAMIAAVALAHGMPLVTRDTNDFLDIGLQLIDPFAKPDSTS